MSIQMPKLVDVKCNECGATDQAWWSEFGSEQPCLNCDTPAVNLIRVA